MRVLIADDHPLFREALHHVATQAIDGASCFDVQDFTGVKTAIGGEEPFDLILLDLNMPGMDGFTGLLELREAVPETAVVIVSAAEEADVVDRAITCGAMGYITKSLPKDGMIEAIRTVLAGEVYRPAGAAPKTARSSVFDADLMERLDSLTRRQRMVLSLLARGKSNKQIAYEMDVTNTTVKAHMTAIMRKLKVTSRIQAVIVAREIDGLPKKGS